MYIDAFWESTTPSQHTSLRIDSASFRIPGTIISEHNGISLFKTGHVKHWRELPKVDRGRGSMFLWSVYQFRGMGMA